MGGLSSVLLIFRGSGLGLTSQEGDDGDQLGLLMAVAKDSYIIGSP